MATPDRRALLRGSSAAALGITSTALPAASAAASPVPDGSVQLASTTVTLTPRGYGDTGTTGAIGVSWDAVTDADSYTVWARSGSDGFAQVGEATAGTSAVLASLAADTSYDVYVVASADDPVYASSLSTTVSANSSIATGGEIDTYTEGATTYVVHAFTYEAGTPSGGQDRVHLVGAQRRRLAEHAERDQARHAPFALERDAGRDRGEVDRAVGPERGRQDRPDAGLEGAGAAGRRGHGRHGRDDAACAARPRPGPPQPDRWRPRRPSSYAPSPTRTSATVRHLRGVGGWT